MHCKLRHLFVSSVYVCTSFHASFDLIGLCVFEVISNFEFVDENFHLHTIITAC